MRRGLVRAVPILLLAVLAAGLFWAVRSGRPGQGALARLEGYATTCGLGPGPAPEGLAAPAELRELADVTGRFWLAYLEAMERLDAAPLAGLTEGGARAALRQQVAERRAAGQALQATGFEHVPLLRGRDGDAAWVRDAVKLVAAPAGPAGGEAAAGQETASFLLVDLFLRRGPDGWAVAGYREVAAEPAAEGVCPLSADRSPYASAFAGEAAGCGEDAADHRFAPLEPALRLGVPQDAGAEAELPAIEAAVRCYWQAAARAYRTLDITGLSDVAGGAELARRQRDVLARRAAGVVVEETAEHRQLLLLQVWQGRAVVDDWLLVRPRVRDLTTGQVRELPAEALLLSTALELGEDGRWRVVGLARVGGGPAGGAGGF